MIGGLAVNHWAAEPMATADVEVVISETVMECAEVFFGHATHTFTKKKVGE